MATEGSPKQPNPLYDPAYAIAPTYPFFYIRYMSSLLTSPIMVHYICQLVNVQRSTTWCVCVFVCVCVRACARAMCVCV